MLGGLLVFDADGGAVARRRFGGLTVLERGVRTLARAGAQRIVVIAPADVEPRFGRVTRRLPVDIEVVGHGQSAASRFAPSDTVLVLLGDHVHHHSSLSAFVEPGLGGADVVAQVTPPPAGDTPLVSVAASGLLDGADDDTVLTGALLCAGPLASPERVAAGNMLAHLVAQAPRAQRRAGDPGLWRRVVDRATARQARNMLFAQVTKKTSGPISRHLNARLSIPISKLLIETGISPHMVTVLFVMTTGLSAAWLMSDPQPYWRLALAGLLWQLAAILDRCDGEIARVTLSESKFGAWFDTVTDNIAYLAAYGAFLVAITDRYPEQPWLLYLGFSAIGAMVVALGVMYSYALKTGSGSLQNYLVGFRTHVPAHEKNLVYRILERYAFIAKRDFFAFIHCLCLLLGSIEALYAYTVGGLHLIVIGVLISQRKMLEGHRRRVATEGASRGAAADSVGLDPALGRGRST